MLSIFNSCRKKNEEQTPLINKYLTEEQKLQHFKQESSELKTLDSIATKNPMNPAQRQLVAELNAAPTFAELTRITNAAVATTVGFSQKDNCFTRLRNRGNPEANFAYALFDFTIKLHTFVQQELPAPSTPVIPAQGLRY